MAELFDRQDTPDDLVKLLQDLGSRHALRRLEQTSGPNNHVAPRGLVPGQFLPHYSKSSGDAARVFLLSSVITIRVEPSICREEHHHRNNWIPRGETACSLSSASGRRHWVHPSRHQRIPFPRDECAVASGSELEPKCNHWSALAPRELM